MELYWANCSNNLIVKTLLENPTEETRADIEKLISGEAVGKTILPELTYADFDTDDIDMWQDYIWSVLYATGYLTDQKEDGNDRPSKRAFDRVRWLVVPNSEVLYIFETQIRAWFRSKVRSFTEEWSRFCAALIDGNAQAV